jgi:hypothetical protein
MARALVLIQAVLLLAATAFMLPQAAEAEAIITVINRDAPGEGFNDPTPAAPVGGNSGATVGAQRLIAFQYAALIWGAWISSSIEIKVEANFDNLFCTTTSAVLGAAGPTTVHRDFAGAPQPGTWYPQALANSRAGIDLLQFQSDIVAFFNSDLGAPDCLSSSGWYYGLDVNPPVGKIDFVTVLVHELGHGLGFLSLVDSNTGAKFFGFDDAYMRNLEDHVTGMVFPAMTNAERFAASTNTGNLHWVGANVVAASGRLSAGVDPTGHVQMFAPGNFQPGSSVSHFDTALLPDEIMEPFYTGASHDVGLALELIADLGWELGTGLLPPPAKVTNLKASAPTLTSMLLSWTAPGAEWSIGTAAAYDIRYATSPITEASFGAAMQLIGEPLPAAAGFSENVTVNGLLCNRTYYFALKTVDEDGLQSPLSNIAKGKTTACNKLIVSPKTLPAGDMNVPYNSGLFDISGGAAPYGVQIELATLPPGVSYGSQAFSGTPGEAKTFRIAATVTDNVGSVAKVKFKLKIAKPVVITTTSLKTGKVNVSYGSALKAKYGLKAYNWSVDPATPLPAGLNIDPLTGKITGIVGAAVSVNVNFRVTDAVGGTDTQTLALTFN